MAQRLAVLAATLAAASAIVFVIVQIVPGDPARFMMGLSAEPGAVASVPVSYTHLDVYKRQIPRWCAPLPIASM